MQTIIHPDSTSNALAMARARLVARQQIRFPGRRACEPVERPILRAFAPIPVDTRTPEQIRAASLAIAQDFTAIQLRRRELGGW